MREGLLRWSAIAIAVAALIDPSLAGTRSVRPRIAVAGSGKASADRVRDRLASDLRADFDVVTGIDATAANVVLVGDRYPDRALPDDVPVSTVTLPTPVSPNVSISAMSAPREAPPNTAIPVDVDVDATGARGLSSVLKITAGGVEVGRVSHAWRADRERWHASLHVIPVGDGPYVFRADAEALPAERDREDNAAGVLVAASTHPMRVLAYDPRPSWTATFARRALESDARFAVSSIAHVSRGVTVRAGEPASLGDPNSLENIDAIMVGGLEQLSAADVRALDRFMRERGGSVALLPDARVDTGPVRDLIPAPRPGEVVLDARAPLTMTALLPRIDASEMLVFRGEPARAEVLARVAGSNDCVIAVIPHGDGRLLFSGALDAWRSRAERGVEFDRFWQSAMAGLALATPPPVDVEVTPSLPAAGDVMHVSVHVRGDASSVSATLEDGEMVRLWPGAAPGAFTGSFVAPRDRGVHRVDVVGEGRTRLRGTGLFDVDAAAHTVSPAAPLALAAASHGGIDVGANDLPALERHLRATIAPARAPVRHRPMRSPWWLLPFAGCLSGEWWLRRRRGAR